MFSKASLVHFFGLQWYKAVLNTVCNNNELSSSVKHSLCRCTDNLLGQVLFFYLFPSTGKTSRNRSATYWNEGI